jgi:hypothetical protein
MNVSVVPEQCCAAALQCVAGRELSSRIGAGSRDLGLAGDPHCFGARIPGDPRLVESLQIGNEGHPDNYRDWAPSGSYPLSETMRLISKRHSFFCAACGRAGSKPFRGAE